MSTKLDWPCPTGRHRRVAKKNICRNCFPKKGVGPLGGRRVVRGGSWNNKPRNVRSAVRNRNTTDNRNNNLGFRLVQSTRTAKAMPGAGSFTDRPGVVCGCP
ncbi:MAG: SUMF1/EgtB/PvdO family nonheme iron enzyme [Thermodesulfobacteriota bacterium]